MSKEKTLGELKETIIDTFEIKGKIELMYNAEILIDNDDD